MCGSISQKQRFEHQIKRAGHSCFNYRYLSTYELSLIHELALESIANQFRRCFESGLLESPRTIRADRLHAEGDLSGDLLDGLTRSDHPQYLKFAVRE